MKPSRRGLFGLIAGALVALKTPRGAVADPEPIALLHKGEVVVQPSGYGYFLEPKLGVYEDEILA